MAVAAAPAAGPVCSGPLAPSAWGLAQRVWIEAATINGLPAHIDDFYLRVPTLAASAVNTDADPADVIQQLPGSEGRQGFDIEAVGHEQFLEFRGDALGDPSEPAASQNRDR